ncbi:MAG: alpha/beta fold hydrolase [Gammaproteobacteria bacterium]
MPYANMRDGTRLYYETRGRGEPLVLLAGLGADHHLWSAVRADFEARHRVIVFDQRGTGASDRPEHPPYSTRGFAADVIDLLDHLGIARAHAYGISQGGRVAQWLGIDHADRVGALVLGCTSPGNSHGEPRPDFVIALFQRYLCDPDAIHAMMELLCSPQWLAEHPEFVAEQTAVRGDPIPPAVRRLHFQAAEEHDAWLPLAGLRVPTLVIHGSDDYQVPTRNAHLLAGRIPGAELVIMPGGRHMFFREFRDEAGRIVRDFLARHPLRA